MKRLFIPAVLAVASLVGAPRGLAAQDFVVIVNEANDVTALTPDEVSRLFLKKTTRWENGMVVMPIDLPESSPVRAAFSEAVHGKPVPAVKAYWQRQIFSGRGVPPVEKVSDAEVLAFTRANPNAIGYVGRGTSVGSGVRAVPITDR